MVTFEHLIVGGGRVTLAIHIRDGLVTVGSAYCHPRDQFCKRVGRDLAVDRLFSEERGAASKYRVVFNHSDGLGVRGIKEEAVYRFLGHAVNPSSDTPPWAYNAMKHGQFCTVWEYNLLGWGAWGLPNF